MEFKNWLQLNEINWPAVRSAWPQGQSQRPISSAPIASPEPNLRVQKALANPQQTVSFKQQLKELLDKLPLLKQLEVRKFAADHPHRREDEILRYAMSLVKANEANPAPTPVIDYSKKVREIVATLPSYKQMKISQFANSQRRSPEEIYRFAVKLMNDFSF